MQVTYLKVKYTHNVAYLLTRKHCNPNPQFHPCARCTIPVPIEVVGQSSLSCPCHDLSNWPNLELPLPHLPVNSRENLDRIRQRLLKNSHPH